MKNLCAIGFEDMARNEKTRNIVREVLSDFKKEIQFMLDEQANELRYVSDTGSEERELIRKIDELKQYVYDMNMSCKSLYKALKSFK